MFCCLDGLNKGKYYIVKALNALLILKGEKKKMSKRFVMNNAKIQGNKTLTAIALILILTFSAAMASVSTANAHTPAWTIPTWCYAYVTNSVIGVNQQEIIVYWLNAVPPTALGGYGDRWTFTVEVTKPDGSKETLGPFTSDPVGGGWTGYTPTQVGTYKIVAKFAEHKITGLPVPPSGYFITGGDYINDIFSASNSDPVEVTVQQQPIQGWQESPLPTGYWQVPVTQANRGWSSLVGNWLAGAAQNVGPTTRFCYGTGPESAHVLWSTQMWAGGIMDARFGDIGYQTGHYEGTDFVPPIILNGKIYYNVYSLPREGWYCLDLYTGKTEYFHNTTGPVTGVSAGSSGSIAGESLAFGQIYNYASPNQFGGMPYLWSLSSPTDPNTWMMFDQVSGNYICSINNVPSWATTSLGPFAAFFGTGSVGVYGKDGSILSYNIVGTTDPTNPFAPATAPFYLQCWNTSRAIWWKPSWPANEYWEWRPGLNQTYDGNNGYSLNASIPALQGSIRVVRENQYVIGGTTGKNNGTYVQQGNLWALNLKPDSNGVITPTLLWNITFTPPQTVVVDQAVYFLSFGGGAMAGPIVDPEDGVFLFAEGVTRRWWGYSLATGQQLWGPTASEPQLNFYNQGGMGYDIYQGMLLSTGFGGELIAYNIKTGTVLWTYTATQVGFESPYGNYPMDICSIADGKIYLTSGEHSVSQPMWRGFLRCVNASNGAELWKILQWGADGGASIGGMYVVMSDGYVVGLNQYDSKIYCYGKGPSATTVTATPKVMASGSSVLIEGTVTDQSPGAKGTPAISDASMEAWMEYLYEQQAQPTNATGVPVTLTAIDPNGNTQNIGTVISDTLGTYAVAWKPPVPGLYTVLATFAGSKSYGGSLADTHFVVAATVAAAPASPQASATPTAAPTQTVTPSPVVTTTPAPAPSSSGVPTTYIIIAVVAVIVVVAAAALALRRRK